MYLKKIEQEELTFKTSPAAPGGAEMIDWVIQDRFNNVTLLEFLLLNA